MLIYYIRVIPINDWFNKAWKNHYPVDSAIRASCNWPQLVRALHRNRRPILARVSIWFFNFLRNFWVWKWAWIVVFCAKRERCVFCDTRTSHQPIRRLRLRDWSYWPRAEKNKYIRSNTATSFYSSACYVLMWFDTVRGTTYSLNPAQQ
jgi:hypothetical protein